MATDAVVDAIDDVSTAVQENVNDQEELLSELAQVRHDRVEGSPLAEILGQVGRPRAVEILDRIVNRLTFGSARLRRALITSLVNEGESVTSVATRFEVTHQRISSILRRGKD
jgi:Mor family transcriptional regulator